MTPRPGRALLVILIVVVGFYLSFELGRYRAGFSLLDSRRQVESLEAAADDRNARIDDLERQVAILETSREIDRETYTAVENGLADLEAVIRAQEEELAFYRGIVSPTDGVAGLRIQNVAVRAVTGRPAATHELELLLVQAVVQNDRVTGTMSATVRGEVDGEPVEYGLAELGSEGGATEVPYGFRYFQTLELGLTLPAGLAPSEIEIELRPDSPRRDPIIETFPWEQVSG